MLSSEIINIGTELLLGDILNTNSRYLSIELAKLGIDLYYHTTVGDNLDRIMATLKLALQRSNIIIITGGLGPTPDDITVEAIAKLFEEKLVTDENIVDDLKSFYRQNNRPVPNSAFRQALKPKAAKLLSNKVGTAPAFYFDLENIKPKLLQITLKSPKIILAFPGVPRELYHLWETYAIGILSNYSNEVIVSTNLKHYGIPESALADLYPDYINGNNPTLATYAKDGECELKITAKASSRESAIAILQPVIDEVKSRSKEFYYGQDNDTLELIVSNLLKQFNLNIAVAESCTAGLITYKLAKFSGASQFLKAGIIAYSNEAKLKLLNVDAKIIDDYGAVSSQCAKAMAQNIRQLTNADIGISSTGIAGPTGSTTDKPIGLVYFAVAIKDNLESFKINLNPTLNRNQIQERSSLEILNILRLKLKNYEDLSHVYN